MCTPARMEKPELYEDDGQAPGETRDSPLLLERVHRALAGWNSRRTAPRVERVRLVLRRPGLGAGERCARCSRPAWRSTPTGRRSSPGERCSGSAPLPAASAGAGASWACKVLGHGPARPARPRRRHACAQRRARAGRARSDRDPHLHRAEPVARRQAGRLPLQRDRLAPGLDRVDFGRVAGAGDDLRRPGLLRGVVPRRRLARGAGRPWRRHEPASLAHAARRLRRPAHHPGRQGDQPARGLGPRREDARRHEQPARTLGDRRVSPAAGCHCAGRSRIRRPGNEWRRRCHP